MNNIPDYKKLNPKILQEYIILDIWTLEEYMALLLQLNPEHFPNLKELINTPRGEKLYKLIITGINADILPCKITRNLYGSQPPLYEFTPLDAVMFATKKGILLFEGMEELVKQHHAPEDEDLEAKYQRSEKENNDKDMLIQSLKEENERLREDLKPLHGGERNGWIKLFAGFIGANYDNLLSKKNIRDWVEVIYKDFENVESSTNIKLYDITFEKSTLIKKLKMVQKYCKEHSKPSTKK
jgi:hypothetical protein